MATCRCGGRPKKNAPALSVLRFQDVALPIFNFGGNPVNFPPTPPLFSSIWAEDTAVLCNRDPDRLYLEFPPYRGGVLTAALKRLWARNCECRPIRGRWEYTFTYRLVTTFRGAPNVWNSSRVATFEGALIGLRLVLTQNSSGVGISWFAFDPPAYNFESFIDGDFLGGNTPTSGNSFFTVRRIALGCFTPLQPEPLQPPGDFPLPFIPTAPPPIIPEILLPPEIPESKPPFPPLAPPPDECCDCS